VKSNILKNIFFFSLLILFSLFLWADTFIITFSEKDSDKREILGNGDSIYAVEFYSSSQLEYMVSQYYVNNYILPYFEKKGFQFIDSKGDYQLPQIKFADLTPKKVEYLIINELDFQVIKEGSLNKNYQLLIVFCKQFHNDFIIRLVEFKLFNKNYEAPNFVSGGVHIQVSNDSIEIIKEF